VPTHIFTVAARGYAIDSQTNNLTLFCVLESLAAPEFPFAIPELTVVTLWERSSGEEGVPFIQRTRLVDPEGAEVFCSDSSFRLDRARHRNILTVQMAPFRTVGYHRIEVLVKKEDQGGWPDPVASYPLEVAVGSHEGKQELFAEPRQ